MCACIDVMLSLMRSKPYIYKLGGDLYVIGYKTFGKCDKTEERLYSRLKSEYKSLFGIDYETQEIDESNWKEWYREAKPTWVGLHDVLRDIEQLPQKLNADPRGLEYGRLERDRLIENNCESIIRQRKIREAICKVADSYEIYIKNTRR